MIGDIIYVLGIVVLTLYGLLFLKTMARVLRISDDTRAMVVLLRRVLTDQMNDRLLKGDDDEQG